MKIIKSMLLAVAAWGGLFTAVHPAFAQTWKQTSLPSELWQTVASSADGSKLIAGSMFYIYGISTNSGTTWITNTEPQIGSTHGSWYCIASSADGTRYAGVNGNAIWVSTNSGLTWLSNSVPGASFLDTVAFSADGNQLVTAVGMANNGDNIAGPIYTSTNWGVTMTLTMAPTNDSTSVASSADGTKLIAAGGLFPQGGFIYTSTNSGLSWALTGAPTNQFWASVACSADGSKLVAAAWIAFFPATNYGSVFTSTNFGMTWVSNNVPAAQWESVSSSADGIRLVAVAVADIAGFGWIYTSTNSGNTWVSNNVPNDGGWLSVASSADGDKLVAASSGPGVGAVYTLQTTPAPQMNITPANGNLALSWIVPSTDFRLQQNLDLTTTNWTDVTNPPVLNLTNLQNEVTFPLTGSNAFYRLKTP